MLVGTHWSQLALGVLGFTPAGASLAMADCDIAGAVTEAAGAAAAGTAASSVARAGRTMSNLFMPTTMPQTPQEVIYQVFCGTGAAGGRLLHSPWHENQGPLCCGRHAGRPAGCRRGCCNGAAGSCSASSPATEQRLRGHPS